MLGVCWFVWLSCLVLLFCSCVGDLRLFTSTCLNFVFGWKMCYYLCSFLLSWLLPICLFGLIVSLVLLGLVVCLFNSVV